MKVCCTIQSFWNLTNTAPDIRDDIREESEKYDTVIDVKIPRPAGARTSPGVGKIFVKFQTIEGAEKALSALAGRKYADRTVVVSYFSEVCLLFYCFSDQMLMFYAGVLRCRRLVKSRGNDMSQHDHHQSTLTGMTRSTDHMESGHARLALPNPPHRFLLSFVEYGCTRG
jgi:splicing factor U2AF subunit